MKRVFHFLVFILIGFTANAQLSCKTKATTDGGTVKTCLHKNGKVSTSETWDKDKRFGNAIAYNSKGEELYNHSLRSVGGHAYVSLEYFANGQVSKVYYSDAPDGGIQFYNSTTKFDENGVQTEFHETKYPHEIQMVLVEPSVKKTEPVVEQKKEEPKQEVVECAILFKNYFEIQNGTTSKVTIKINALQNNTVIGESREIVLEPSRKFVFDTVFTAQVGLQEDIYKLEIVSYTRKHKNKHVKLMELVPIETSDSRTYYWFVMKE